jgi:uncharacterized protein
VTQTANQIFKRIALAILSALAIAFIWLSLAESAKSPQAETRLDLMQTDLILQVSAWQPPEQELITLKNTLMGSNLENVYLRSLESYKTALDSNKASLNPESTLQSQQKSQNINDLSLRLGILYAKVNKLPEAIATWQQVSFQESNTAQVLRGIWSEPALIFPDAELQVQSSLNGWFRTQALTQLYQAQQRPEAIAYLDSTIAADGEKATERLLLTSSVTVIGGGLGVITIIILGLQRLFFAKSSPLQPNPDTNLSTPWRLSKTWEVMVLWFTAYVAVSQIFLPAILHSLNIFPDSTWTSKDRAILILIPYIASMAPMLLVFGTTLREFLPFPDRIFKFKFWTWSWLGWGLGGYAISIPIVLLVSILNQRLLGGQGGGNPLLPILAQDQNNNAKLLLWITVAIAAPFFEELLFRGFLLPSLISGLSNWLPKVNSSVCIWIGICASGLIFAIAHLNLADILPLTALGIVMGFVYVRSQNLLAPMLLHALWNSGTFFTLLVLNGS